MSAQHDHPADPRTHPIPRTIDAIADTLTGAKRMEFYREIGQAEAGEEINATMRKWWMEAMFERRPGRAQRLADADAGRGLRALPDLAGEGERE